MDNSLGFDKIKMNNNLLTSGQLERKLSQKIQAFYRVCLGHQPSKVTCQFFSSKLAIVIENSITSPEQLLINRGKTDLANQVHHDLNNAIQPDFKQLIEEITEVKILDFLSNATLTTGRTGIIAILSKTPLVKNPETIPKAKK